MTSRSSASSARCLRNHSRIRRLKRFRHTAFPTLRLAVRPRRLPPKSPKRPLSIYFSSIGNVMTTSSACARRFPPRITRRKSRESRSRSDRRKRPVRPPFCAISDLLGRNGCRKTTTTLGAATLQDFASRLRLHSLAKTVLAKSLDSARLVSPLHGCGSSAVSRLDRSNRLKIISRDRQSGAFTRLGRFPVQDRPAPAAAVSRNMRINPWRLFAGKRGSLTVTPTTCQCTPVLESERAQRPALG
jgi:hypothetical protein